MLRSFFDSERVQSLLKAQDIDVLIACRPEHFSYISGIGRSLEHRFVHEHTTTNTGLVRGRGTIDNTLVNSAGGEVRVGPGQHLHMTGNGAQTNAGDIEVIGIATELAEIEFDGALTNAASTGDIIARNATLRFNGGLTNQGAVGVSFGTSDIHGDINNQAGATISIQGDSNVTFWDDLTNNGMVEVATGSMVAHFGTLSGEGSFTGGGTNFVEGGLSPGSSPGTMSFDGDLVLGSASTILMELAGTATGEYDRLVVAGTLEVAGDLVVQLLDDFAPTMNNGFQIFDAMDLSGMFSSLALPDLLGDLGWNSSHLYTSGTLFVISEPTTLTLLAVGTLLLCRRWRRTPS